MEMSLFGMLGNFKVYIFILESPMTRRSRFICYWIKSTISITNQNVFCNFFCKLQAILLVINTILNTDLPYIAGKRVTTGMWVNQVLCDYSTISSPNIQPNRLKFGDGIVDIYYFVEKSEEGPRCITARLIQGQMQQGTEEVGPKKGEYTEAM